MRKFWVAARGVSISHSQTIRQHQLLSRGEISMPDDKGPSRTTMGIIAILLGGLGIHKFMMGMTTAGIIQICLYCCFGIGHIIGIIEGVIYLTKTDEEFYQTYIVGKKQWF